LLKHIKYFTLLPCLALLTNNAALAQTAKKERWFEVEVILFQQLGDKTKLKEQFPDDMPSAATSLRHKRFIELLTPFLKPDISSLKLQLPICGEKNTTQDILQQALTPIPFYQTKTLTEINALTLDDSNIEPSEDATILDTAILATETENNTENETENTTPLSSIANETSLNNKANDQFNTLAINDDFDTAETFTPLTPEMIALVKQAEEEFSPFKLELSSDHLPKKSQLSQQRPQLCLLSPQVLAQLSKNDASFKVNDFPVDKVPSTIDAAENIYSAKPYLLAKSSLKLNDIVKQLRWSKAFKPLLHLGWRLAPKGRRYAIPLHIFAGDNLQIHYKKQLVQYNKAINAALKKEQQALQTQIISNNNELVSALDTNSPNMSSTNANNLNKTLLTEQQQYQQTINKRLNEIFAQLNNITQLKNKESKHSSASPLNPQLNDLPKIDKLITDLNNDKLALKLTDKISQLEQKYHIEKPQPPLQNWFLDGWFKVHLNHYLFITANMTLLNKTLAEQASDKLKVAQNSTFKAPEPLKLIEFKQDRRVISKEIHYFDNPYLGMIVQIRRYQRPEPPVEDEEQTDFQH